MLVFGGVLGLVTYQIVYPDGIHNFKVSHNQGDPWNDRNRGGQIEIQWFESLQFVGEYIGLCLVMSKRAMDIHFSY